MICIHCQLDKPLEDFHPNRRYKTGYSTTCESCFLTIIPQTMICLHCGIDKPLEEYARATKTRNGHQQPCNTCRYAARYNERLAAPNSRVAQWLKSSWVCKECQVEKPIEEFRTKHDAHTGHIQPCKQCNNKRARATKAAHPEKFRQNYKQWLEKNREKESLRMQKRRKSQPQTFRKYKQKWTLANPLKARSISLLRRTRASKLPYTFTKEERTFMLQYWGYSCAICGNQEGLFGHTLADDHWIAVNNPACPGTVATNMLPLCHGIQGCNNKKGDRDGKLWLMTQYNKSKTTRILKAITTYFDIVRQREQPKQGIAS